MVPVDSRRVSRAPRYSGIRFESGPFSPTRLSRSLEPLSMGLRLTAGLVTLLSRTLQPPLDPKVQRVWAMSDFARHYFRNRGCFLFLQVLRWFTSLGLLVSAYVFSGPLYGFTVQGFPIRRSPVNNACLRLTEAYRSLPRPSSPSSAKASTVRP